MAFNSATFLFIFLPLAFVCNLIIKNIKAKNAFLIVFSLLFCAWSCAWYALLLAVSAAVNWLIALAISREAGIKAKKWLVVLSIAVNIGALIYFKYTGFFVRSFNSIFGMSTTISSVALPIGISFFTFQAQSYVLDVYRGDIKAVRGYFDILLYISLFPRLMAGPIIKYEEVAEQIKNRIITADASAEGLRRFIIGLAKKVLIANVLGSAVDAVYALDASLINFSLSWIAALAYLMQIYFDFSGYSDMAIGLGKMFGFDFPENFNYPYISKSITEFWRRWHITLSRWFKYYVYIPLGGNRKGKARTTLNKFIVFLLTGLWHGANWTFAVWGIYNGAFLFLEDATKLKERRSPKWLLSLYALTAVTVGFVIFRAPDLSTAWLMIKSMFSGFHFSSETLSAVSRIASPIGIIAFVCAAIGCTPLPKMIFGKIKYDAVRYAGAVLLFVLCILALATSSYNPFIYAKF